MHPTLFMFAMTALIAMALLMLTTIVVATRSQHPHVWKYGDYHRHQCCETANIFCRSICESCAPEL